MGQAGENLLRHIFGPAVGVGTAAGAAGLPQRHFVVGGVYRGGGGENDVLHPHFLHHLGEDQGGVQVVVIVFPGLLHAFSHCLQAREMNDAFNCMLRKNPAQEVRIPHIPNIRRQGLPRELLHAAERGGVAIAQVVDGDHFITAFQQLQAGVRANIAHTASYQYCHFETSKIDRREGGFHRIILPHGLGKCNRCAWEN